MVDCLQSRRALGGRCHGHRSSCAVCGPNAAPDVQHCCCHTRCPRAIQEWTSLRSSAAPSRFRPALRFACAAWRRQLCASTAIACVVITISNSTLLLVLTLLRYVCNSRRGREQERQPVGTARAACGLRRWDLRCLAVLGAHHLHLTTICSPLSTQNKARHDPPPHALRPAHGSHP